MLLEDLEDAKEIGRLREQDEEVISFPRIHTIFACLGLFTDLL